MKMSKPKAYKPCQGQRHQILVKNLGDRTYKHLAYAKDGELIRTWTNYRQASRYDNSIFMTIQLPKKYWK